MKCSTYQITLYAILMLLLCGAQMSWPELDSNSICHYNATLVCIKNTLHPQNWRKSVWLNHFFFNDICIKRITSTFINNISITLFIFYKCCELPCIFSCCCFFSWDYNLIRFVFILFNCTFISVLILVMYHQFTLISISCQGNRIFHLIFIF